MVAMTELDKVAERDELEVDGRAPLMAYAMAVWTDFLQVG